MQEHDSEIFEKRFLGTKGREHSSGITRITLRI